MGTPSALPRALLALLAAGSCAATRVGPSAPQSTARPADPVAGAAGIGDPYFPGSGNGGYDVLHYDLRFSVEMPVGRIDAVATLRARALIDLAGFQLDFTGPEVGSVRVAGEAASFRREAGELVVEPLTPLRAGAEFQVQVAYAGVPALEPDPSVPFVPGVGWWRRKSGIYVLSECLGARSWFPCNDHPIDKASYAITVDVPKPWVAAANGILVGVRERGDRRIYSWRASDPMASYLATVDIARFDVRTEEGPHGLPLRFFFPLDAKEEERAPLLRSGEMIAFFEERFGPYPFESAGGLLAYEELGGAIETQTLPVYSRGAGEETVAHELAHQWFGNCVTPERWRDLWLSEGFATYAEWLWAERVGGPEALERRARRVYRTLRRRAVGPPLDPGVAGLFTGRTYLRGAWLLHGLRRELGDELFFSVLRRWIERYRDANANTEQFVELCAEVAGRDLDGFFDGWLRGAVIPVVEEYEPSSEGR